MVAQNTLRFITTLFFLLQTITAFAQSYDRLWTRKELNTANASTLAFVIHALRDSRGSIQVGIRDQILDEAGKRRLFSTGDAVIRVTRGQIRIGDNLFELIASQGLPSLGNRVLTRRGEMMVLYYFYDLILAERKQVVFLRDGRISGFADARQDGSWNTRGLTTDFWMPPRKPGWMRFAPSTLDPCLTHQQIVRCLHGLGKFIR